MLSLTLRHSTDSRRSRGRGGEDVGGEGGAVVRQGASVGLVGPDAADGGGGGGRASGTHYMFLGVPQMFEGIIWPSFYTGYTASGGGAGRGGAGRGGAGRGGVRLLRSCSLPPSLDSKGRHLGKTGVAESSKSHLLQLP